MSGASAAFVWRGNSAEPAPPKPIVIGGILALSGDAAALGTPIRQAVELAAEGINAEGGVRGRMIELRFEDGKCEREDAELAAQKLLDSGIDYLLAGGCSSEFLAAAPIAQSRNIISFSSSATSPDISALGPLVFRTAPSDAFAGMVAARYAMEKMGARKLAIVAEGKAYTEGLRAVFAGAVATSGGTILIDEVFPTGTTDFSRIVEKLKATPVDVIYVLPQSPTPGILLIKALKEANVDADILTAEVLLIRDAIAEQGEILEGVTGIEILFDEKRPKAARFAAEYERTYSTYPAHPSFMAGAYDFVYLIKEAIEATDGSVIAVSDYLYSLEQWDGALGKISFDEQGDPELSYSVRTVKNKEAVTIDEYIVGE